MDSTQAFLDAWTAACGSTNSNNDLHIYLKEGINLLGSVSFEGHNYTSPDITLRIDGTRLLKRIIYRILGQANDWLSFERVSGVSIVGGALDAKGSSLWGCKAKCNNCPAGATVFFTLLLNLISSLSKHL